MYPITELQLSVLRSLWARGESTPREVADDLRGERDLATTTVATLLSRLEKRGIVTSRRRERSLAYAPAVSEEEVVGSFVDTLTENVFGGNVSALVSHLLSEREIGPGDRQRLRELLENNTPPTENPHGE